MKTTEFVVVNANFSRSVLIECCSTRTVSAEVTHPEHAKQSAMDTLAVSIGVTETGRAGTESSLPIGPRLRRIVLFLETTTAATASAAVSSSFLALTLSAKRGFTHACEGAK